LVHTVKCSLIFHAFGASSIIFGAPVFRDGGGWEDYFGEGSRDFRKGIRDFRRGIRVRLIHRDRDIVIHWNREVIGLGSGTVKSSIGPQLFQKASLVRSRNIPIIEPPICDSPISCVDIISLQLISSLSIRLSRLMKVFFDIFVHVATSIS
jgi:hypothetical protein